MQAWVYSLISVFLISLFSFVGVLFVALKEEKLRKILLFLVSFAAGGLLGGVFLHLIPEAAEQSYKLNISFFILAGVLVFFVLEKFICWRHCHIPTSKKHPHPIALMNLIGDGFHNFIDGLLIAGSFSVNLSLGIATSVAVILHEIPQEIGDFGVLIHGGFSKTKALLFNFISGLMALAGAAMALLVGVKIAGFTQAIVPFTAGGFIYIAGADLIPELKKETNLKKSFFQLLGLVLGIAVMLILTKLE